MPEDVEEEEDDERVAWCFREERCVFLDVKVDCRGRGECGGGPSAAPSSSSWA